MLFDLYILVIMENSSFDLYISSDHGKPRMTKLTLYQFDISQNGEVGIEI